MNRIKMSRKRNVKGRNKRAKTEREENKEEKQEWREAGEEESLKRRKLPAGAVGGEGGLAPGCMFSFTC